MFPDRSSPGKQTYISRNKTENKAKRYKKAQIIMLLVCAEICTLVNVYVMSKDVMKKMLGIHKLGTTGSNQIHD